MRTHKYEAAANPSRRAAAAARGGGRRGRGNKRNERSYRGEDVTAACHGSPLRVFPRSSPGEHLYPVVLPLWRRRALESRCVLGLWGKKDKTRQRQSSGPRRKRGRDTRQRRVVSHEVISTPDNDLKVACVCVCVGRLHLNPKSSSSSSGDLIGIRIPVGITRAPTLATFPLNCSGKKRHDYAAHKPPIGGEATKKQPASCHPSPQLLYQVSSNIHAFQIDL